MYGLLQSGLGGLHAELIRKRKHHRSVCPTTEVQTVEDLSLLEEICRELGELVCFVDEAENSWYKFGREDIYVLPEKSKKNARKTKLLSAISSVVHGLKPIRQKRVYVPWERKREAEKRVRKVLNPHGGD